MADNAEKNQYNHDEYVFDDLSLDTVESTENASEEEPAPSYQQPSLEEKNHIRRNALIAVAVLVLGIIIYNLVTRDSSYQPDKKVATIPTTRPEVKTPMPTPIPQQAAELPVPSTSDRTLQKQEDRIAAMESSQESMRSELTAMGGQLEAVTQHVDALAQKMVELNQALSSLNEKLDAQLVTIERLTVRQKQHARRSIPKPMQEKIQYYLQAVIPGRAWLIATNGSTLTVREGTPIRGYGIVRLIDPAEGRVMTSSGRVIRFSQEDS